MPNALNKLAEVLLPKGKGVKGGKSYTATYNPRQALLTAPTYRDHLTELFNTRSVNDSRALVGDLVNHDPDMSAAVHSYLTISGSAQPVILAYNENLELDREGIMLGWKILSNLTTTNDYTLGFSIKPELSELLTDMRYWILLRGMLAGELVLDKAYLPTEIRLVDSADLEWSEKTPGRLTPSQKPAGANQVIDLNVPTFFTTKFHQNPDLAYTFSPFVAAINTVAARQDIINELYRIMTVVGYPRLDVEVLEEVMLENVPASIRTDPKKAREFVETEITKIRTTLAGMTAQDAFVHSNGVQAKVINDKNPGAGLQIERVIEILDNQNQSALKVMPAVVGRTSSQNTASTEARLFALSADALNNSVAAFMTKLLTLAVRLTGYAGKIEFQFRPVEMRQQLELEPQLTMRRSRLTQDLSLGVITDDDYHLQMYGRLAPEGATKLSGTNFLSQEKVSVDETKVTPNSDPLGRSLTPEGSESAASSGVASGDVP